MPTIPYEFSRTEMLLGTAGMEKLRNSHVAVFGAGGVGSHCIEALARSGVGTLSLVDHDTISITNINRQSLAFHSTIGRKKTEVMKALIADISPSCRVFSWPLFVLPENLPELMVKIGQAAGKEPDYLIDAVDTVSAKLALAEYASQKKLPLIASMGTGNKLHPECFEFSDIADTSVCPLCRVMRRELKKRGIHSLKVLYSKETPLKPSSLPDPSHAEPTANTAAARPVPGSVSFVPPAAGLMIAGAVVRELCGI